MIKKNITALVQGGKTPKGEIEVSGAKNSATRLLAAALISDEKIQLNNFPVNLIDAQYKIKFIVKNGGKIEINSQNNNIEIDSNNFTCKNNKI